MSAFVCSARHVAEVAKAIVELTGAKGGPQLIAFALARENIASVCYRYADDKESNYAEFHGQCVTESYAPREVTDPVAVLHLAHCLDYQSCEHDGWGKSTAKRMLDDLCFKIDPTDSIHNTSTYNATPYYLD